MVEATEEKEGRTAKKEKKKEKRKGRVLVISFIPSYCDTKYFTDRLISEIFEPLKTIALLWNTHYLASLFKQRNVSSREREREREKNKWRSVKEVERGSI